MRNSECTIYIITSRGSTQTFRKDPGGEWVQTSGKGIKRVATAEQVLSHILPLLAKPGRATLKVVAD